MAIVPTGAIYKSLVFDGESSRDYGIYITGQAVYNAPERDVEMINIPGRNGSFALDKGRFQNIEVTYPAGIFADTETDFAQGISDFRNFLCSRSGYVRLTDEYNPDEYRMAVYKSGLEVSPAQLKAGEFNIVFDCKPQRYLTSGEEPVTIGEWHETETASGSIASFEAKDGDAVKSLVADIEPIQSLNGYDKPWSGGAGKNLFKPSQRTVSSSGITYSVDADGKVTLAGTATATTSFTLIPSGSGVTIPETGYYTASLYGATNAKLNEGGNSYTINLAAGVVPSVFAINVTSGTAYNESFYVQFEKGMTATAYEPYSNICPISGHTECVTERTGKNLNPYQGVDYTVSNTAQRFFLKSGTYTFSTDNGTQLSSGANIYIRLFDAETDGNIITSGNITSSRLALNGDGTMYYGGDGYATVTFTLAIDAYMCFGFNNVRPTNCNAIQLEVGSSASDYVPYIAPTTYTTDLNGTRYGGTLDVVSGVLTVTKAIVDMTNYASRWTADIAHERAYVTVNEFKTPLAQPANIICNRFKTVDTTKIYTMEEYGVGLSSGNALQFRISGVTDQPTASTATIAEYFANNPTQVVYELATPTTVQLTAEEVELLVGLNQVWANSGDVSVEYGTAPNVLINPTLFESSPMLEVEGYGNININDDAVTIQNEVIGTIQLTQEKREEKTLSSSITCTLKLPTGSYQAGDEIYSAVREVFLFDVKTRAIAGYSDPVGVIATQYIPSDDFVITAGTAKQGTETGSGTNPVYRQNTWVGDYTLTENMEFSYDGIDTITVANNITISGAAAQYVEPSWLRIRIQPLTVDSTKPVVDGTIFIDLDIGEAWVEDGGEVSPANNVVAIPAELPKLKSGVNTITYDNTIDYTKITPRWWKI